MRLKIRQCQKLKQMKSQDIHLDLGNQKEQRHYIWFDTVGKPGKCQTRRRETKDKQPRCDVSIHHLKLISWSDTGDSWEILRRPFREDVVESTLRQRGSRGSEHFGVWTFKFSRESLNGVDVIRTRLDEPKTPGYLDILAFFLSFFLIFFSFLSSESFQ